MPLSASSNCLRRGEYTAFPALNIHHCICHILHKVIVHDLCHDCHDNGIFQRQLSDTFVFGGAGVVLLGIHTAVIKQLDQMMAILEQRKRAFREEGCPDLDTYNQKMGSHAPRFVFACDEVAELLDKTGADSERKKLLAQIENKLSTIARQGRAFGIHLILATQRPDATIIPGQIRNNIDFRVCGRADSVLSQIILDNTNAAEQIPKDARGRFITGDGTVFQGYLFGEGQL